MKRYFLVRDEHMPTIKQNFGVLHYIALESHGAAGKGHNLVCMCDEEHQPPKSWMRFPPLVDSRTTLAQSPVPHEALADVGLSGQETCAEAVAKLGDIHPLMGF